MTKQEFYCRSCDSDKIHPILDLGETPLANGLLLSEQLAQPEPIYPLELVFCENCTLVQITESVSPDELFSDYVYFSSFSDTLLVHSKTLVESLIARRNLDENSLVVEIASNDGYLLQNYHQVGIPVLGVEPAQNIATVAQEKGIRTLPEFFGEEVAARLLAENELADVIHANNVMAHVPDINGVVKGFQTILKPEGIIVSESPYVKDLIDQVEFDTIYHEHLFYYSLTAQDKLFARHGLTLFDVERLSIHGGSLRIYAGHADSVKRTDRLKALLAEEQRWGVQYIDFYANFGQRVKALKTQLRALVAQYKQGGASIAAYGASAKGSTLLNYFGIGAEILDFVADRSTVKQGYYTPGTRLPIVNPDYLLEKQPDYVLLLVWNFADEILKQQAAYREKGGKFIIPIPEVQVL
ncbi:MAG: class I SAM-dependent methyltransferase [Anaerolineae bacterium]|nr:class I SAM-dependent methyltransferase [Anaerolineae bacterium]